MPASQVQSPSGAARCGNSSAAMSAADPPRSKVAVGTGTCKRGVISQWRAAHPSAHCVHIGNGRVSDTCGAIAADLAFAKETLAEELESRGVAFERFDDLNDVVASLESRVRDLDA